MLRRLSRLLIIALLIAAVAFAVSKLMGGDDDDFDDFEDLDSGFEFQETPVEIDVPATDTNPAASAATSATSGGGATKATGPLGEAPAMMPAEGEGDNGGNGGRLIDINGIGPAYEARLQAIGIGSISDLANADADSISSQIEVIGGAATIGDWITQAQSHGSNGQS